MYQGTCKFIVKDSTSLVKVSSTHTLEDDDTFCVTVWTDNPYDGRSDIWLTKRQLAQFCQQVDAIWVDTFMAPAIGESR